MSLLHQDPAEGVQHIWIVGRKPERLFCRGQCPTVLLAEVKVGQVVEGKDIVGIAEVIKEAYPDPSDKTGKFVCVDIKADKPLPTAVTMAAIKAEKKLAGMALVKYSRLSVQPVTADEWKMVCKMGGM